MSLKNHGKALALPSSRIMTKGDFGGIRGVLDQAEDTPLQRYRSVVLGDASLGALLVYELLTEDQVRTFETRWKGPTEILSLATLATMDRDGEDARSVAPFLPGMERSIHVPVTRVDVSSTAIRALVARGSDVSGLVPEAVVRIIRREGLYRP